MSVLVCGGAGFIGSHMVSVLIEAGEEVIVLDNFQKGHWDVQKAWEKIFGKDIKVKVYQGDIRDRGMLDRVFTENNIDAVIDFAADSLVGESVIEPLKYFNNNVGGTISLLEAMRDYKVKKIVFSSTAATYGEPEKVPILEENRTCPTNPYGETKLTVEKILKWCDNAYGIKYTALRYFNAAGAHPSGYMGEDHRPESHLIPKILEVALGKKEKISIFGEDYDTLDGTCLRDYIHVLDLAKAHLLALKRLKAGKESSIFNLGNGTGFSVREVIQVARRVTGKPIIEEVSPRRPGDPARLIASSYKAINELGWKPRYASLEDIIESAWNWHLNNPNGYER